MTTNMLCLQINQDKPPFQGVLLGIFGGSVPLSSSKPDPISDHEHIVFHTHYPTWLLKVVLSSRTHYLDQVRSTYCWTFFIILWYFYWTFLLVWSWKDRFIRPCSFLENNTRFKTIMGVKYTLFLTKTVGNRPLRADTCLCRTCRRIPTPGLKLIGLRKSWPRCTTVHLTSWFSDACHESLKFNYLV